MRTIRFGLFISLSVQTRHLNRRKIGFYENVEKDSDHWFLVEIIFWILYAYSNRLNEGIRDYVEWCDNLIVGREILSKMRKNFVSKKITFSRIHTYMHEVIELIQNSLERIIHTYSVFMSILWREDSIFFYFVVFYANSHFSRILLSSRYFNWCCKIIFGQNHFNNDNIQWKSNSKHIIEKISSNIAA